MITAYDSSFQIKGNSQEKNLLIPRTMDFLVKTLSLLKMNIISASNLMLNTGFFIGNQSLWCDKTCFYIYEIAWKLSFFDLNESVNLLRKILENTNSSKNEFFCFFLRLILHNLFLNLGLIEKCLEIEFLLKNLLKKIRNPIFYNFFLSQINERLIISKDFNLAYNSILNLIDFNNEKGLFKLNIKAEIQLIRVFIELNQMSNALLKIEKTISKANEYELGEEEVEAIIYKAFILGRIGKIKIAFDILKGII